MTTPRRNNPAIKVYCLEAERTAIEQNAMTAGLSTSRYLRAVGIGTPIFSVIDQRSIQVLAKINADQGRLGGLFKLLLTNDERFDGYSGAQLQQLTEATLADIRATQTKLRLFVEQLNAIWEN